MVVNLRGLFGRSKSQDDRTGIFTWLKAPATIYNPAVKDQLIYDYRGVLQQVNGAPSDTRRIEEKTLETSDFVNPVCNREIAAAWSSSRRVTADAHRNRKNRSNRSSFRRHSSNPVDAGAHTLGESLSADDRRS